MWHIGDRTTKEGGRCTQWQNNNNFFRITCAYKFMGSTFKLQTSRSRMCT
jgi:hypothetical protein